MKWRLIPLFAAPGRVQMAIDRWLLEQHSSGSHPSTLRFYTWSPAAISLGYHQHKYPEAWQHLTWQGQLVDLVRRPTGGRAVLHQGELTYAVVTSGLNGSRTQVYQKLCDFLIQGWRSLGIELHYGTAGRGYIDHPNCFGTATSADLVLANGTKLIGSAQLFSQGAVLQHGSIRLEPDTELFAEVFGTKAEPIALPMAIRGECLTVMVAEALMKAATSCFDMQFEVQPLSPLEWAAIESMQIKYGSGKKK
ncbi:lipoate--protein ligase family protein [Gloeocapsopsis dulcis]|uniref:Biotin--protein ligase n=1 Tax=Gloeocapsopsis dulcis AAB1 = 1H9 TaxID=1433147 RepID=A0A6N8G3F9_9CHRO|nr:biotin/lipoate A/B protein ligase family protein [Gloeocapsopsis dulcis]MUL39015.1 biotin--protein ligase [Gloeocapsopsis dulcis AAB1 = 1H9]WNN90576.1 biotin/lipoate A/B protein ligase family protein [Gloeocapsopsis dulcis]